MDFAALTGGSQHIRRLNQEAILQLVKRSGPMSRTRIARELGLNPSTVNRLVEQLEASGLLTVSGEEAASSRGGRPARLVSYNADAAVILAVDLSNAPWRGAVVNLGGEILERFSAQPVPGDAAANLMRLETLLLEMWEWNEGQLGRPVRGIGIGAPSITLWQEGVVVWAASLGWRNLPLKAWGEARWAAPVFVENDVNLLALGESWQGAGRQSENLVVLAVGTGIGAGLILNGKLYRGANEAAGEVGYLPPDPSALGVTYTGYGPLEALAAAPGLVARARQALAEGVSSALSEVDPLTAEDIYDAARAGDPLASQLVEETARYLSLAVAGLATVLNPDAILIAGEMERAADLLLGRIRALLEGLLPVMPRLEPAALGQDAVLYGAVALVLANTSAEVAGVRLQTIR